MERLQFACCVVTLVLALILAMARLQVRWINRRYEQSRWILCLVMVAFAVHYYIQMAFGLRASSDEMGAVVNILLYTPSAFAISFSILNITGAEKSLLRRHLWISAGVYLLLLGCFGATWPSIQSHHLSMGLYAMMSLFVLAMIHSILIIRRELRRMQRVLKSQTGSDFQPYTKYMQSGVSLLYAIAITLPLVITSSTLLLFLGPPMLIALLFFMQSFIALGYYYEPLSTNPDIEPVAIRDEAVPNRTDSAPTDGENKSQNRLTETRIAQVEAALNQWCEAGGFRNCEANMTMLSMQLQIEKGVLTRFFDQHLKNSFRSWLSNIRFKEVQRMMIEFPQYSNDAISFECGFSSHAHLYKIFKEKTGLTPGQWKEHAMLRQNEVVS